MALVLLAAVAAQAQPPRGFYAWWDSPVARDLHLTPEQTQNIRQIVRAYRGRLIDGRGAVRKAEAEVEDLFNDDRFDEKRTSEAIERLADSRRQLTRAFSEMAMKLRSQISAEQWRELMRRRPRAGVSQPQPQDR